MSTLPRCKRGTRRNKKTKECEPTTSKGKPEKDKPEKDKPEKDKPVTNKSVAILPRCPRGSRRNKKTGKCDSNNQRPVASVKALPPLVPLKFTVKNIKVDIPEHLRLLRTMVAHVRQLQSNQELPPFESESDPNYLETKRMRTLARAIDMAVRYLYTDTIPEQTPPNRVELAFTSALVLSAKLEHMENITFDTEETKPIQTAMYTLFGNGNQTYVTPYEVIGKVLGTQSSAFDRHMCLRVCLFVSMFPQMYRFSSELLAKMIVRYFTSYVTTEGNSQRPTEGNSQRPTEGNGAITVSDTIADQEDCDGAFDHLQRNLAFRFAVKSLTVTSTWTRSAYDYPKVVAIIQETLALL